AAAACGRQWRTSRQCLSNESCKRQGASPPVIVRDPCRCEVTGRLAPFRLCAADAACGGHRLRGSSWVSGAFESVSVWCQLCDSEKTLTLTLSHQNGRGDKKPPAHAAHAGGLPKSALAGGWPKTEATLVALRVAKVAANSFNERWDR